MLPDGFRSVVVDSKVVIKSSCQFQPKRTYKKIIMPIIFGAHWCLAVADFKTSELMYYDSMLGENFHMLRKNPVSASSYS